MCPKTRTFSQKNKFKNDEILRKNKKTTKTDEILTVFKFSRPPAVERPVAKNKYTFSGNRREPLRVTLSNLAFSMFFADCPITFSRCRRRGGRAGLRMIFTGFSRILAGLARLLAKSAKISILVIFAGFGGGSWKSLGLIDFAPKIHHPGGRFPLFLDQKSGWARPKKVAKPGQEKQVKF
jgi:hypothetical protein